MCGVVPPGSEPRHSSPGPSAGLAGAVQKDDYFVSPATARAITEEPLAARLQSQAGNRALSTATPELHARLPGHVGWPQEWGDAFPGVRLEQSIKPLPAQAARHCMPLTLPVFLQHTPTGTARVCLSYRGKCVARVGDEKTGLSHSPVSNCDALDELICLAHGG